MGLPERLAVGILLLLIATTTEAMSAKSQTIAKPGCPTNCGNLTVPYPFGTREGCFLNENMYINCSDDSESATAFLGNTGFVVSNISLEGQLQILSTVSRDCYPASEQQQTWISYWFQFPIFMVSKTRNKLTGIGCDTHATIGGILGNSNHSNGCLSSCDVIEDVVNGSCSGSGCCQTPIPNGLKDIDVIASFENYKNMGDFNLCGYAFIVEDSQFNFSTDYIRSIPEDYRFPMSLDWVLGNETCEEAKKNKLNFTCRQSECYEPEFGQGYLCKCPTGYQGNPYLPEGCLDIDECKILNPCVTTAECYNSPGSFKCTCKSGYEGDGSRNGTGCSYAGKSGRYPVVKILLVVNILLGSILVLVLSISLMYWGLRRKKHMRQKEKFFRQNGGIILQEKLSTDKVAKIFTAKELEEATNNYHESRILGIGGQGTVYKGLLEDNRVVAIKKSMITDHSQVQQFINEILVLSQVNHRNVVKLLGCCLETQVPLLVYEFISNGTLYHHLHNLEVASFLPWETRLQIAAEAAGAVSYLHSVPDSAIIHRDIKSTNILLDEHYTAKVSDFGASRLVPSGQTKLNTLVQGTLGYLDPEYLQSSVLTEKSDVYNFGVVLVELLTGRKALCSQMPEEERSLAMHFISSLKKNRLVQILDHRILLEENVEQLEEVAMLANSCLRESGTERPSMKEVSAKLEGLRANTTETLLGLLPGAGVTSESD